MKKMPKIIAAVVVGGMLAKIGSRQLNSYGPRILTMRDRMMKQMLASMPEDSPPRIVQSVLPRLQAQNDQILELLASQDERLRALEGLRRFEESDVEPEPAIP